MKTNKAVAFSAKTHEGGRAFAHQNPLQELERAVATCLLWENTFYEKGNDIADRIAALCQQVSAAEIVVLACKARNDYKLRHVPLFLVLQLIKHPKGRPLVSTLIQGVVQRPDEMGELLSLYWKDGKKPLPNQMKKGLAAVFTTFTTYQLAKWDRDAAVKLKDVMFLVHPKPVDTQERKGTVAKAINRATYKRGKVLRHDGAGMAGDWKKLVEGTLDAPDTWEVALSAGKDKKATWERLLREKKLGDMALLMNLRNMSSVHVDRALIVDRLRNWSPKSVALPFRFISAAQAAPDFEDALGEAMIKSLSQATRLPGRTLYVIDVSGSMRSKLSEKSTLDRVDAACGLAMLMREVSEDVVMYATGGNDYRRVHATAKVPPRHTFALRDVIKSAESKLGGGGIFCHQALTYIKDQKEGDFDRVIILTDEQDCDLNPEKRLERAPLLGRYHYLLNVASYKPGLELGGTWIRINGWSERVIDWIRIYEQQSAQ